MSIDRIYIPTVNRVDNQITYNGLPDDLKAKVTMVVQAWERDKYQYPCEYLVLPDSPEYHYSDYYCIPRTRKVIYQHGQNMKYAMLDDDLIFSVRNSKYFGGPNDMDKSKRICTPDDILEMFETFDQWLDEPTVTVCGCSQVENPPGKKLYRNNTSLSSALWINGQDFRDDLDDMDLTSVRVAEDAYFLLSLLTMGYGNRVSERFVQSNQSNSKNMESDIWDTQEFEQTLRDHLYIQSKLPGLFEVLYTEAGNRVPGGYKGHGKVRMHWAKAYKYGIQRDLNQFFAG